MGSIACAMEARAMISSIEIIRMLFSVSSLRKNWFNDFAMDIGQSKLAPLVFKG